MLLNRERSFNNRDTGHASLISKDPRLLHLLLHQAFGNRSITVYTCFIDLKSFFATLVRTTISLMRGKRFINSAYNSSNLNLERWKRLESKCNLQTAMSV